MRHLLLTGAAGQVGQYLLRDLLVQGVPIAVLLRGRKGQSPEVRIERILAEFEAELGRTLPRPVCLQGDIAQERLGLSHDAWHWATEHCGRVLHNAASVAFHGSDRQLDPWLSNVTGTRNILEFTRQADIREFHYMSTAYVCGKRRDTIFEDETSPSSLATHHSPLTPHEFRNDYEQSKYEAEQLVREAAFLDRPTIYRPATVVGDSRTGRTTSYHGLYSYLRFIAVLRQSVPPEEDGRWRIPMRFSLTGNERRNLVTIDWVSAVSTHIVLNASCHGKTYHLTPPRPITSGELDAAFASYFQYYGHTLVGPDGLVGAVLNDLEKLFYGQLAEYADYWHEEPIFDCRNTRAATGHLPCPTVDKQLMARLIDFAVRDRWGKRRPGSA